MFSIKKSPDLSIQPQATTSEKATSTKKKASYEPKGGVKVTLPRARIANTSGLQKAITKKKADVSAALTKRVPFVGDIQKQLVGALASPLAANSVAIAMLRGAVDRLSAELEKDLTDLIERLRQYGSLPGATWRESLEAGHISLFGRKFDVNAILLSFVLMKSASIYSVPPGEPEDDTSFQNWLISRIPADEPATTAYLRTVTASNRTVREGDVLGISNKNIIGPTDGVWPIGTIVAEQRELRIGLSALGFAKTGAIAAALNTGSIAGKLAALASETIFGVFGLGGGKDINFLDHVPSWLKKMSQG